MWSHRFVLLCLCLCMPRGLRRRREKSTRRLFDAIGFAGECADCLTPTGIINNHLSVGIASRPPLPVWPPTSPVLSQIVRERRKSFGASISSTISCLDRSHQRFVHTLRCPIIW